jgi:2-hydroxychromene-2-carboxylate isomerase
MKFTQTSVLKTVHFYFDFISPYAFLSVKPLKEMVKLTNTKLVCVPVLFAGFLKENETKGPAEIPSKRRFLFKDITRIGYKQNIRIQGPPIHPFNPLLPLRVVSSFEDEMEKLKVTELLFHACWVDGKDISDEETVSNLLEGMKLNFKEILEKSKSSTVKEKLIQQTNEAIKCGVFGVPSFKVDNEVFWGQDRIQFLQEYIEGTDIFCDGNKKLKMEEILSRPTRHRKISKL